MIEVPGTNSPAQGWSNVPSVSVLNVPSNAAGATPGAALLLALSPLDDVPQLAASKRGDRNTVIMAGFFMLSSTPDTGLGSALEGAPLIAGVDEAGRGPLAGPVVAAAAVICKPLCDERLTRLDDSKKLSGKTRAMLEPVIRETCAFGIAVIEPAEIDRINIFAATMLAMTRAVEGLEKSLRGQGLAGPDHALIDGNMTPEGRCDEWRWPARAIVGGDALEPAISAASILAKEHRDRIMREAAKQYPAYGWERNMGYGTKEHMAALKTHGPTPLHRRSFAPVAQLSLI